MWILMNGIWTDKILKPILGFVIVAVMAGCSNSKHLPENKYLLVKNSVETNNSNIEKGDVDNYIKQKPNKKILGFYRFHLSVYTLGKKINKDGWLKDWLMNTIGEEPVVLDTSLTNNTVRQLNYYLENKGYFNGNVDKYIEYQSNSKAK